MSMKIRTLLLVSFLLLTSFAEAQFTSVSGTVTDLDNQTWNNGKWSVTIYNQYPQSPPNINGTPLTPSQLNQSGFMNSSGALSLTLGDSSLIAPAGTYWVFTICPNASAQCVIVNTPVSGGSQDISSILSSNLKGPRFSANSITGGAWGYLDAEIYPTPNVGAQYFNVTTGCTKFWNGSTWACYNSGLVGGITNLTGDAIANGPGSVAITLASVNSAPGSCGDATHSCTNTTNAKGLVTNQVSVPISYPTNNGITAITGDMTATGPGSVAGTLATVNTGSGSCGDSTHSCQITTNAKGLTVSQSAIPISTTINGTDYYWTDTSCSNGVSQPVQCLGTTTLPGNMPDASYQIFVSTNSGSQVGDYQTNIAQTPLPTTIGSTIAYRTVQIMQNGGTGGAPVLYFHAHHN